MTLLATKCGRCNCGVTTDEIVIGTRVLRSGIVTVIQQGVNRQEVLCLMCMDLVARMLDGEDFCFDVRAASG